LFRLLSAEPSGERAEHIHIRDRIMTSHHGRVTSPYATGGE